MRHHSTRSRRVAVALLTALALAGAACSRGNETETTDTTAAGGGGTTAPEGETATWATQAVQLAVARSCDETQAMPMPSPFGSLDVP